jgi:hypothetical protein
MRDLLSQIWLLTHIVGEEKAESRGQKENKGFGKVAQAVMLHAKSPDFLLK